MLKRDHDAQFRPIKDRIVVLKYELFIGGRLIASLSDWDGRNILTLQENEPIQIAKQNRKTWWMFKGKIYWEDEDYNGDGYTEDEVKSIVMSLIVAYERRRSRKIERAKTFLTPETAQETVRRKSIPDDIKLLVWQRDCGKCVKCGNRENLEYDHIIPLSRGGSNTARNIQLLCQDCNRSKGDSLI